MPHQAPICIIPARGGSKRIPRKNIADMGGKPMIARVIDTALESGVFSKVIVSTDDAEIAQIAKDNGAKIPFMRSQDLADDHATTGAVLADCLERLSFEGDFCCMYPTSVLVQTHDLDQAWRAFSHNDCASLVSVCDYEFHPLRAFSLQPEETLAFHWPQYAQTRSQDLPVMVHDAGCFYFSTAQLIRQTGSLVHTSTRAFHLPRTRAVDIDTPEDLEMVRALFEAKSKTL